MIALDPYLPLDETPGADAPLRLAAATDQARAFLVIHFPPAVRRFSSVLGDMATAAPEHLAELEREFVSELRELGGMAVVA